MQALKEQFKKYYTPKRCLINALIMFAAVAFFITQRSEQWWLSAIFGCIGLAYTAAFFYLCKPQKV